MVPCLPPLPDDFVEDEVTGLSVTPWDEGEVLLLTTTTTSNDVEEDAAFEHAQRRGPKSKAEMQASLTDRDPYGLLELEELRWRASADDIKKAYRRMVLMHHPDKQMGADMAEKRVAQKQQVDGDEEGGEEDEKQADEVDEMFKAITEAFELLSDPKRRRDFDSLDDFDDSIPPKDFEGDFFAVFSPVFERNSRWSERPNAPLLGAPDAEFEKVAAFYNFWFDFKSWRDFADADEFDLEDAHFREEKRYMEKKNEKLRAKKRKVEGARISRLVDHAYAHDPRVLAEKTRAKESKAAAKAERAAAVQRDREAAAEATAAKEAAKAEEERIANEKERAEAAERKRLKEKAAKALRKARGRLRLALGSEGGAAMVCDAVNVELLCARLDTEKMEALCVSLEAASLHDARVALVQEVVAAEQTAAEKAEEEKQAAEREAAERAASADAAASKAAWTDDELSLLVKAANKFPGGVPDRWERMAEFINHFSSPCHERTADDITVKVKERRRELEVKKAAAAAKLHNRQESAPPAAAKAAASPPTAKHPTASHATATPTPTPEVAPKPPPASAGAAAATVAKAAATTQQQPASATIASAPAVEWSDEQQRALETALKKFPASAGADRWDRISENVPGKSKSECVKRYKEIVAALKAKKQAGAT